MYLLQAINNTRKAPVASYIMNVSTRGNKDIKCLDK